MIRSRGLTEGVRIRETMGFISYVNLQRSLVKRPLTPSYPIDDH